MIAISCKGCNNTYAAQALQGLLAGRSVYEDHYLSGGDIGKYAVEVADLTLKELEK